MYKFAIRSAYSTFLIHLMFACSENISKSVAYSSYLLSNTTFKITSENNAIFVYKITRIEVFQYFFSKRQSHTASNQTSSDL